MVNGATDESELQRVSRALWLPGPWDEEPDQVEFSHAGLPCVLIRVPVQGSWCGYVAVPAGHQLFGVPIERLSLGHEIGRPITWAEDHQPGDGERSVYGRTHRVPPGGPPGKPSRNAGPPLWWIGFDCSQNWDLTPLQHAAIEGGLGETFGRAPDEVAPALQSALMSIARAGLLFRASPGTYRTLDYTRTKTRLLAEAVQRRECQ